LKRPRILLADDHRVVAEGLKTLLSDEFDLTGVAEDGRAMLDMARAQRPDVIVADISMPGINGIDALVELRGEDPDVRVVFLTMHKNVSYARRALEAGALGYVLKHSAAAEVVDAIHSALAGERYVSPRLAAELVEGRDSAHEAGSDPATTITPRQKEILQLLADGRTAKEIGDALAISPRTVEFHKYKLMEALDLHTSADLILFAIKNGIVSI
jgi:DNA-binding NarL/FixJ family response regulator